MNHSTTVIPSAVEGSRCKTEQRHRGIPRLRSASLGMTTGCISLRSNSKFTELPRTNVRNRQRKISVNVAELQKFAVKAVRCCLQLRKERATDLTKLRKIFVWLISDRRMASLHRQFLQRPGPTDVLTFQHGEIFISAQTAQRHARRFGNSLQRELRLYVVHGLLHLHGFDDRTQAGARRMERIQKKILRCAL